MSISIKRGNTIIKVIEDVNTTQKVIEKENYSNVLNVRVNRPFNTIADSLKDSNGKRVELPKVNIQDAVAECINKASEKDIKYDRSSTKEGLKNNVQKLADDLKVSTDFDASSNFIPNAITDPLKAFGLTDADFEETDDTTSKIKDEVKPAPKSSLDSIIANTAEKIEKKYAEYFNDDEDNFEKIPRSKSKMDNY